MGSMCVHRIHSVYVKSEIKTIIKIRLVSGIPLLSFKQKVCDIFVS